MALVYIRGPYSAPSEAERLANVEKACEAAVEVIRRGDTPIVPHLSHYIDKVAWRLGAYITWNDWMRVDFEILRRCDIVLPIGDSLGSRMEEAFALGARIPTYLSLKDYCAKKGVIDGW